MNLRSFIKRFSNSRWDIGIITTPIEDILNGNEIEVSWITHRYKDSWFADPFVLQETDDELVLLAEEFYKPINRGRISKLWVDKNNLTIEKKIVILELNSHLSFPAYYVKGNDVFIYPENGESGHLFLYKLNNENNRCERIATLCNKPLEDAIKCDFFGRDLLFATSQPDPNGKILEILDWDDKKKRYVEYLTFEFQENVARMSGMFFRHNGKIYRPTQECNTQYGHAVTLQEVNIDDNGQFDFKEVRRLYSVHPKYTIGMHTFNVYRNGVIMTDALTFDKLWFRKLLIALRLLPKR